MQISIIIPTYNEAAIIGNLVRYLVNNSNGRVLEILVSDGGSHDFTIDEAVKAGATVIVSPKKGRAAQLNYAASIAKGNVLYFIHADTMPPATYTNDIMEAIDAGFNFGRYRTQFTGNHLLLKVNAFFTRFDLFVCYGGDQTLFMSSQLFNTLRGYNEQMLIMEDYDIVARAKEQARYKILGKNALVSTRKYDNNGWLKVQKANYKVMQMFKKGSSQTEIITAYKKMLNYR